MKDYKKLLNYMAGDGPVYLEPKIKPDGYTYPDATVWLKHNNVREELEEIAKKGYLSRTFAQILYKCPDCHSCSLNLHPICDECGEPVEHNDDQYYCNTCSNEVKKVNKHYNCLSCEAVFAHNEMEKQNIYAYTLTQEGKQVAEKNDDIPIQQANMNNNIYDQEQFNEIGTREFYRSIRYEAPLSLATIRPVSTSNDEAGGVREWLSYLTHHCQTKLRKSDIVSVQSDTIYVLLPETKKSIGTEVIRRLSTLAKNNVQSHNAKKVTLLSGIASANEADNYTDLVNKSINRLENLDNNQNNIDIVKINQDD